jgi:hypothetical protein
MDYLKGLNVIILSLLLILTGCFGMLSDDEEDSVEAQNPDDTTTVTATLTAQDIADAMILASNSPPKVSVKTFDFTIEDWEDTELFRNNWLYSGFFNCLDDPEALQNEDGTHIGYTLEEQRESVAELESDLGVRHLANMIELGDCVLYFDFVSVDPDGDSMTKGIDTDFDGIIDIPITPNDGMVIVGVDNSTNKDVFNGLMASSCEQIDVAFIAVDEHGASTAEFMHFLGVETCDEEDYDSGGLDIYSFSATDGPGSNGEAIVTMDSGSDLDWSHTTIIASVDGAASESIVQCAEGEYENCWSSSDSETDYWNVGEAILIDTSCASLCTVTISILNSFEGVTLDTVMVDVE